MSDLPKGWARTTLGSVCTKPQYGWTTSAKAGVSGLKLLRTTDISSGTLDWNSVPTCVEVPEDVAKYQLAPGDIVVSRAGSVGLSYRIKDAPAAVFASYLIRLRPLPSVSGEFIDLFLKSPAYWAAISEGAAGIAVQNINATKLAQLEFLLPPLFEQKRIVARVEALLAEVKAARERLEKALAILKQFRQSVLGAACSGRLTEEWRAHRKHPDWDSRSVAQVCDAIVDCPHSTPKWVERGEICLRTTNFSERGLDLTEVRYVSPDTFAERISRLQPKAGDVVYSREGGILGIACVIPEALRACLGQRMMLMRCRPGELRPQFLAGFFNSPATAERVRELTGGTASPHLNVGDIKEFVIPLPSLEEQDEILRRTNALLSLSDRMAAHVERAQLQCEKAARAILAKAFGGELAPTEAELARAEGREYESATQLLARVQAERKALEPVEVTRRNSSNKLRRAGRPNKQIR